MTTIYIPYKTKQELSYQIKYIHVTYIHTYIHRGCTYKHKLGKQTKDDRPQIRTQWIFKRMKKKKKMN